MSDILNVRGLQVGDNNRVISEDVSLDVAEGSYTAVIGPNACGKSTLLRAIARILPTSAGSVLLDGKDISQMRTKHLAQQMGMLPQSSIAPDGMRVADLVARGRHPHQRMFECWSAHDEEAVIQALDATGTTDLSGRLVDELSAGQRQRSGWRWSLPRRHHCCFLTNRRRSWISRTSTGSSKPGSAVRRSAHRDEGRRHRGIQPTGRCHHRRSYRRRVGAALPRCA